MAPGARKVAGGSNALDFSGEDGSNSTLDLCP